MTTKSIGQQKNKDWRSSTQLWSFSCELSQWSHWIIPLWKISLTTYKYLHILYHLAAHQTYDFYPLGVVHSSYYFFFQNQHCGIKMVYREVKINSFLTINHISIDLEQKTQTCLWGCFTETQHHMEKNTLWTFLSKGNKERRKCLFPLSEVTQINSNYSAVCWLTLDSSYVDKSKENRSRGQFLYMMEGNEWTTCIVVSIKLPTPPRFQPVTKGMKQKLKLT